MTKYQVKRKYTEIRGETLYLKVGVQYFTIDTIGGPLSRVKWFQNQLATAILTIIEQTKYGKNGY